MCVKSDKCLHENMKFAITFETLACDRKDGVGLCEYQSTEDDSLEKYEPHNITWYF